MATKQPPAVCLIAYHLARDARSIAAKMVHGTKNGRHPQNALSAIRVRNEKCPGMYTDGNGLYLRVDPSGTRRWVQRIVVNGRRRSLGLWPSVSMAEKHRQSMPTFTEFRS